ncbi:AMP-binding protein [Plantactinospora sp. B5E13]|uniref:AMP-binding protein n=1 Tax=Plantactinospora sp. B5E13 TaxID=3153758 RepID=UPI00325EB5F8
MTLAAVDFDLRLKDLGVTGRDRQALVFVEEGRAMSYDELNSVTEGLKHELMSGLSELGPACLLVDSPDGIGSYLLLVAALRCPVPVALRSRLDGDRTAESLLRAGIAVLDASQMGTLHALSPGPGCAREQVPPHALILPTGGTSGEGRRVIDVRTRMVPSQPRPLRLTSVLGWRPHQVQMMASIPPHASSMSFLVEGLADGNTIVVPAGFRASAFLELIDEHQVRWIQSTPFHLRMMQKADNGNVSLGSVRALVHMSARCADDLKRYWIQRLGPEKVYETYGSTEGVGVTVVDGNEWLERPGTVGKGFFTKVRIVGPNGETVPPGVQGTVYTSAGRRGAQVYLNSRGDVRRSADGSVSVGDEGWLDPEGYLYLAPRSLSRITVAGETFDAEDLESVLCDHPDVADAGVCSVERGEDWARVIALVVPEGESLSEAELRLWLRSRVTTAIVPRRIFRVAALPRDGAGKVSRRRLQDLGERLASTGRSE